MMLKKFLTGHCRNCHKDRHFVTCQRLMQPTLCNILTTPTTNHHKCLCVDVRKMSAFNEKNKKDHKRNRMEKVEIVVF